jgi:hypothetical protein
VAWRISGSYFESCNCDPICPCRRIDGKPGGRSTHGECLGVLCWAIEDGCVDELRLDGLGVALAIRYHDDEVGSPWTWAMYVDARADDAQHEALVAVYSGRLGGDALRHFPWAWKESRPLGVRRAEIEVSHEPRRQRLRIRDRVTVTIRGRWAGSETVTCVVPGHERAGEELVAEELRVAEDGLRFDVAGTCGYGAGFAYSG